MKRRERCPRTIQNADEFKIKSYYLQTSFQIVENDPFPYISKYKLDFYFQKKYIKNFPNEINNIISEYDSRIRHMRIYSILQNGILSNGNHIRKRNCQIINNGIRISILVSQLWRVQFDMEFNNVMNMTKYQYSLYDYYI
jgi:hypothetical protein